MHGLVSSSKVSPLEAIHRAQVPFFALFQADAIEEQSGSIAVPYLNLFIAEVLSISIAFHEPYKLFSHSAPKNIFGCEYGKAFFEIVSHLIAEFTHNANACSIRFLHTCVHNVLDDL